MKIFVKTYWQREDGWAASTTAIVMAVISAISTSVAAAGSYSAARAQSKINDFNAKVSANNAKMAQDQAAREAERTRDKNRKLLSSQRAALTAAGVNPDSGSALDLKYDSEINAELDRLTALYSGTISSKNSLAQSQLDTMQGRAARTAGYFNTSSTFLSGAASTYFDYQSTVNNPNFNNSSYARKYSDN